MINSIKIYCEGITDQIFIADFIGLAYNLTFNKTSREKDKSKLDVNYSDEKFNVDIYDVGGCSNLKTEYWKSELKKNILKKCNNIVIFDADYSGKENGNKGFNNCKSKLDNLRKEFKFDYYIWPNDSSDGEIEDLLINLVPAKNDIIFNCIDSHQKCLKSIQIDKIDIKEIDLKTKLNYYLHITSDQSKPSKRNYADDVLWDINNDKVEDLKKLRFFFDKYFLER